MAKLGLSLVASLAIFYILLATGPGFVVTGIAGISLMAMFPGLSSGLAAILSFVIYFLAIFLALLLMRALPRGRRPGELMG